MAFYYLKYCIQNLLDMHDGHIFIVAQDLGYNNHMKVMLFCICMVFAHGLTTYTLWVSKSQCSFDILTLTVWLMT